MVHDCVVGALLPGSGDAEASQVTCSRHTYRCLCHVRTHGRPRAAQQLRAGVNPDSLSAPVAVGCGSQCNTVAVPTCCDYHVRIDSYAPVPRGKDNWQGTPSIFRQCNAHDAGYTMLVRYMLSWGPSALSLPPC
jgi:hypothetical protein